MLLFYANKNANIGLNKKAGFETEISHA